MPSLHLINSESALAECLGVAASEDTLLLMAGAAELVNSDTERQVFVLADDVADLAANDQNARLISYTEFVDLVATHRPIVTWR